jgi:hypothetical protein
MQQMKMGGQYGMGDLVAGNKNGSRLDSLRRSSCVENSSHTDGVATVAAFVESYP